MADLLTQVKRDIDNRLIELRPVLDEARRLERARDALARSNSRPRRSRAQSGRGASTRSRMSKAKSRELDRRVLALLSEDPTQRPTALALLTETSVASMNSRLNRLVDQGELRKRGRGKSTRYHVPKTAAGRSR